MNHYNGMFHGKMTTSEDMMNFNNQNFEPVSVNSISSGVIDLKVITF